MKPIVKRLFAVLLLLLCVSCKGQQNPYYIDVPDNVTTTKTAEHVQTIGSRVFMVMPEGFVNRGTIWSKADKTTINVLDVERAVNNIGYGVNTLEKLVVSKNGAFGKHFIFNEQQAYICNYQYNKEQNQMLLLVGDNYDITSISATYKKDDAYLQNQIKSILLSLFVDREVAVLDNRQYYDIDLQNSGYGYVSHIGILDTYCIGGKISQENTKENTFIVSILPKQTDSEIRKNVQSIVLAKAKIKSPKYEVININDKQAMSMEGKGVIADSKVAVYDVVIKGDHMSIHFLGTAYNNFDTNIEEFKKIASTLRLKEHNMQDETNR